MVPVRWRGVFFVPGPAVEGGRAGDGHLLPIVLAAARNHWRDLTGRRPPR